MPAPCLSPALLPLFVSMRPPRRPACLRCAGHCCCAPESCRLLPLAWGWGLTQAPAFRPFLSGHLFRNGAAATSLRVGLLSPECAALTTSPGALAPAFLGVPPAQKMCCQQDLPTQLLTPQRRGRPGAGGTVGDGTELHGGLPPPESQRPLAQQAPDCARHSLLCTLT